MKKRVAALTMVCVLATISLAACGTADSKGTTEGGSSAKTEAGTTEAAKPETAKSEAEADAADAVDEAITEAAGKASGEKYKIVFSSYSQTHNSRYCLRKPCRIMSVKNMRTLWISVF